MKTMNSESPPGVPAMHRRGREGSALLISVTFMMILGIVTGAMISAAVTHRKMSKRAYDRERAFNIAEAGLEVACQTISTYGDFLADPYYTNRSMAGGVFRTGIDRTSSYTYAISSTGIVNNVKWIVQARRVEQPSWAKYALWMDTNGVIYFIGGETFNGHVHSNTRVYFDDTDGDGADFLDRMTSAASDYGGTLNGATFAYGLELNADQDSMANVNFTNLQQSAEAYGLVLTGQTVIVFTNTNMRITNSRKGWTNFSTSIGTNNIIYVKDATSGTTTTRPGAIYVSGKVDGRVTIVSEDDTYIQNHLTYAVYPTNSGANDAIGIVSKDDIWVNTSMPNNANIHAAMMATGQKSNDAGSFGVINHNSGSVRGNLNVMGSIVQEVRGAVGTFSGSGISTGYAKKYGFDQRFRENPPPFYPRLSTKLTLVDWREGPK